MHKDDLAQAIMGSLETTGEMIVNPRCDECGTRLSTPEPSEIGMPRMCTICSMMSHREHQARSRDWMSQERPRGRTIHVVRLPDTMVRK
jgi:hypothetical protein